MELMIVLAIAGTVAAMGIPGLIKWLPDYRLKHIAGTLYADMHHTRMMAVKTGNPHAIFFDTEHNSYILCSQKGPDNDWKSCLPQHIEKKIYFSDTDSRIAFGSGNAFLNNPADGVSYQKNTLVFNPLGTGSAGYVYLTNPIGTCYKVGTQSSGIVLLRKWNKTNWE